MWLTDIIKKELNDYALQEGNTYITSSGPAESKETGNMYHNFVVQIITDDMMLIPLSMYLKKCKEMFIKSINLCVYNLFS